MNSISAIQSHHHNHSFHHHHHFPSQTHAQLPFLLQTPNFPNNPNNPRRRTTLILSLSHNPLHHPIPSQSPPNDSSQDHDELELDGLCEPAARSMIEVRAAAAAASIGLAAALYLLFVDEHGSKAMALGPEGPLMEEFWDNVRRYALYALTVSTGALYTVFLPIWELLKNPISAILVLVIFAGGFYILTQVVSAMAGLTDFDYSYAY